MRTNAPTPQPEDVETLLRAGIAAAKAGQRERARDLLMRVVEQDVENVLAWLWLSGVVDSLDDREVCLENVLALDSDNDVARNGLAMVRQQKADRLLREGIAAAKAGQRERARELLMRVVERDEENVSAWLWLSGVVDSLDDRQVCLENALTLDPNNAAAHKGLDWVRKQKETQAPPPAETVPPAETGAPLASAPESPTAGRARTPVSPAAAVPHEDLVRRQPSLEPELELPPSTAWDEFDDEYLCPYCAAPTEPQDRKCKACGGKLWINFRKQEKRSTWLWVALSLQALNTLLKGVVPLQLSAILFGAEDNELAALLEMYAVFADLLNVSSATIEMWLIIAFFVSLLLFVFSLAVLIALYLRWKPAFYLYLINAVLGLAQVLVDVVRFLSSPEMALFGGFGYVCSGITVLITLAMLWLAYQIKDDFPFERQRILLRLDPDVTRGPMFLARGHEYVNRRMWALAALHMWRAVAAMPDRMDGRAALTLTYLRLKRYDLAARALAEARRINPGEPRIEELQTLLDDMRSADQAGKSA